MRWDFLPNTIVCFCVIAYQTLLFVSVLLAMDNQGTLLLGREQ